jgi:DNA replication protein DnaC
VNTYFCPECKGLRHNSQEPECRTCEDMRYIAPQPNEPEGYWRPCPVCAERFNAQVSGRLREMSGLTDMEQSRYRFETFDSSRHPELPFMLTATKLFAEGKVEGLPWSLTFLGGLGNGKTHLLCASVADRVARRMQAQYVSVPEWFAQLRGIIATEGSADTAIDDLVNVPFLAVDDLPHRDSLTDFQSDAINRLVNGRYRERDKRPTLVASNMGPHALPSRVISRLEEGDIIVTADIPSSRLVRNSAPIPLSSVRRTSQGAAQ